MHVFNCEMDLALTYALRNRELAIQCARNALVAAVTLGRPDLAWRANSLLGVL